MEVNKHWMREPGHMVCVLNSLLAEWGRWEALKWVRQLYFSPGMENESWDIQVGSISQLPFQLDGGLDSGQGKVGGHDNVTSGSSHRTPVRPSSLSLTSTVTLGATYGRDTLTRWKEPSPHPTPWVLEWYCDDIVDQSHLPILCPQMDKWILRWGSNKFLC